MSFFWVVGWTRDIRYVCEARVIWLIPSDILFLLLHDDCPWIRTCFDVEYWFNIDVNWMNQQQSKLVVLHPTALKYLVMLKKFLFLCIVEVVFLTGFYVKVSFCVFGLKETGFPQFLTETKFSKVLKFLNKQYQFTEIKKVIKICDNDYRSFFGHPKNTIAQGWLGETSFLGLAETSLFEPQHAETNFKKPVENAM